jgi:hypothetical protein
LYLTTYFFIITGYNTDELDDESKEENVLCPRDEQQKLKRGNKAIVIHSETDEDYNELQMTNETNGDESSDVEFIKKDRIENSIALGSRMATLMTDLELAMSSDHVEDEEVDNHNNCTRKSKKSLKLNKSENMKRKRHVTKSETDTKV